MDKNIYHLTPDEYEKIESAPGSLEEALAALEDDHEFLLEGGVFTADVIHYWIKYKRENEVDAIRQRPHPYEFCMYFDI
jgi:glutamine synthetase